MFCTNTGATTCATVTRDLHMPKFVIYHFVARQTAMAKMDTCSSFLDNR